MNSNKKGQLTRTRAALLAGAVGASAALTCGPAASAGSTTWKVNTSRGYCTGTLEVTPAPTDLFTVTGTGTTFTGCNYFPVQGSLKVRLAGTGLFPQSAEKTAAIYEDVKYGYRATSTAQLPWQFGNTYSAQLTVTLSDSAAPGGAVTSVVGPVYK